MVDGQSASEFELFISYSSQDRERVLAIAAELEAAGVRLWVDRAKIEGGTAWGREIVLGVQGCKVFALMCSDSCMRSRNVAQEIQLAWKYQKPYLPLLLESISYPEQVEYFLEGWQWIEVLDQPRERWLPRVLQALTREGVSCAGAPPIESGESPPVQAVKPDRGLKGLRSIATFTDQIWPVSADRVGPARSRSLLRDLGAPQDDVQHGHKLGSRVALAIESERAGHLLLLDEGTSAKIYCLCPSWFAPSMQLPPGLSYLPQEGSQYDSFAVTGDPGREHLLAIVTDEPLGLDWLPPDPQVPARVLSSGDVDSLLEKLEGLDSASWTALATYFDVVGQ